MIQQIKKTINFINAHPIASKHKLKAYFQFVFWQFSQLIFPKSKIIDFVKPTKLLVSKGMTGATGNIYSGLHEFFDMGFLLHFLRADDLFFDIGANVGTYTVLAAGVNKARVVSFEPVPSTFNSLNNNIKLNRLESLVSLNNIGIGAGKSVMKFTSQHDTVNHVLAKGEFSENVLEIQVESIDELIKIHGCPALIKIDVEGFETEVINGMDLTLKDLQLKVIIIELNGSGSRYDYDESLIHKKLLENGFYPFEYLPYSRELIKLNSYGNLNTIYIRDIEFATNRVSQASFFEVFNEKI